MKAWTAIALLLASSGVGAQTLYKCVSNGKPTSYQSHPCDNQQTTVKTWAAQPEPEPTNSDLWRQYYAKKRGEADSRYLSNIAGRSRASDSQGAVMGTRTGSVDACAIAKRQRDEFLNGIGRDAGIDARRIQHDNVYNACK